MCDTNKVKTSWDKAAVIIQAVGGLAIFVSVIGLGISVRQFNEQQKITAAQTLDQQRETTLSGYLDDMSTLMLQKNLKESKPGSAVRTIAIARTATALRNLDGARKGALMRYLWEARLINEPRPELSLFLINLNGAVFRRAELFEVALSKVNLFRANFINANLAGAELRGADMRASNLTRANLRCFERPGSVRLDCTDLRDAYLFLANLSYANLVGGKLNGANLSGANLSNANLVGANLTGAHLRKADLRKTLYNSKPVHTKDSKGNTFTFGPTQWPRGFDIAATRAVCVDC